MAIIEFAFRRELHARFLAELGGRISDSVFPPKVAFPAAVYARVGITGRVWRYGQVVPGLLQARIQLTLRDPEYTPVKLLQEQVEQYFLQVKGWMGVGGDCCPVLVDSVQVVTMPDIVEPKTRHRLAISDFIFQYQDILKV